MPDNQMTESEIVKALECCAEQKPCKECPLRDYTQDADECKNKLFVECLDLINRKNAECKECGIRTSECIEKLQKQIAEKDAEIEGLENLTIETATENACLHTQIKYARAEAIKEFVKNADEVFGHYWGKKESVPIHDWLCVTARIMGVETDV